MIPDKNHVDRTFFVEVIELMGFTYHTEGYVSNELDVRSYKIARHSHKSWLFRSQVFVLSSSLVSNPLSLDCEGFRRRPTD